MKIFVNDKQKKAIFQGLFVVSFLSGILVGHCTNTKKTTAALPLLIEGKKTISVDDLSLEVRKKIEFIENERFQNLARLASSLKKEYPNAKLNLPLPFSNQVTWKQGSLPSMGSGVQDIVHLIDLTKIEDRAFRAEITTNPPWEKHPVRYFPLFHETMSTRYPNLEEGFLCALAQTEAAGIAFIRVIPSFSDTEQNTSASNEVFTMDRLGELANVASAPFKECMNSQKMKSTATKMRESAKALGESGFFARGRRLAVSDAASLRDILEIFSNSVQ